MGHILHIKSHINVGKDTTIKQPIHICKEFTKLVQILSSSQGEKRYEEKSSKKTETRRMWSKQQVIFLWGSQENFLQRLALNKMLISGTKIILGWVNIMCKCPGAYRCKMSLVPIGTGRGGAVLLEQSEQESSRRAAGGSGRWAALSSGSGSWQRFGAEEWQDETCILTLISECI